MFLSWFAPADAGSSHVRSPDPAPRRLLFGRSASTNQAELLARGAVLVGAGAWQCDLDTNALTWTDGIFDLFGLPRGARLRREETVEFYSEPCRAELERLRADAITRRKGFTLDAKIVRPDGARRWMRVTAGIECRNGRPTHLYGLKQDITREREKLEALRKAAEHDALTGLASRSVFQSRFINAAAAARAASPVGALVLFDIDGFKQINDQYGHSAGDACLAVVASRISACFPDAAMIARIGGDEFALILGESAAEQLSQRVAACLSHLTRLIAWNGESLGVSASAGLTLCHDSRAYDPEALFAAADSALYQAKRSGRNRLHLSPA